jgi:AraC family transcriptional regulator, regulatory protein of adaptative response / DNA-3-methyladenine glycosylase II
VVSRSGAVKLTSDQSMEKGLSTLRLPFVRPYDWNAILEFLRARSIPGVEVVDDASYHRTIELNGATGTLSVSLGRDSAHLVCVVDISTSSVLDEVRSRLIGFFDLAADISAVERYLSQDGFLAPLIAARPGLRVPGGWDPFEVAIRALLGQQISVSAARRLAGVLTQNHGTALSTASRLPALTHTFPSPRQVATADDLGLGMPKARLKAIADIAQRAVDDPDIFVRADSLDQSLSKLLALRGIGEWTAHYIAMRAMREMDAFPATDVGILRGVETIEGHRPNVAELVQRAKRWRPWRAYAAQHLWTADVSNRFA